MRKKTEEAWKRCPKCGRIENQIKAGYNASGSQRCKCKECGIYYTIDPKRHEYPEETRELAIKMYYGGTSGRGVPYDHGKPKAAANRGTCCKPEQIIQDDSGDG